MLVFEGVKFQIFSSNQKDAQKEKAILVLGSVCRDITPEDNCLVRESSSQNVPKWLWLFVFGSSDNPGWMSAQICLILRGRYFALGKKIILFDCPEIQPAGGF